MISGVAVYVLIGASLYVMLDGGKVMRGVRNARVALGMRPPSRVSVVLGTALAVVKWPVVIVGIVKALRRAS